MFFESHVYCRFCSKIFCCSECRTYHEKNNHLDGKNSDVKRVVNFCYSFTNSFVLQWSFTALVLSHILDHLSIQCLKCYKIFTLSTDIKNLSSCAIRCELEIMKSKAGLHYNDFSVKSDTPTSKSCKSFGNDKSTGSISGTTIENNYSELNFSEVNVSSRKIKEGVMNANIKLIRTTSTPMQKLLLKFYETNFDGSQSYSSIESTESDMDLSSSLGVVETSSNASDKIIKKNQLIVKNVQRPLRQTVSTNVHRAFLNKFYNGYVEDNSHLDFNKVPIDKCQIHRCYAISSKSIIINSSILGCSESKEDVDKYMSCNSLQLVKARQLETKRLELNARCNTLQLTPKCTGINKKPIDVKTFGKFNELIEGEKFYTPSRSMNEPDFFFKNEVNTSKICKNVQSAQKTNFGEKIWSIFSSLIPFPLLNKKYTKLTKEYQIPHDSGNTCRKRKRSSSEDLRNYNDIKRIKRIYSRQPIESYKIRTCNS